MRDVVHEASGREEEEEEGAVAVFKLLRLLE